MTVTENTEFNRTHYIKHHRIPVAQMSFIRPNLSVLIQEIEEFIKNEPEKVE